MLAILAPRFGTVGWFSHRLSLIRKHESIKEAFSSSVVLLWSSFDLFSSDMFLNILDFCHKSFHVSMLAGILATSVQQAVGQFVPRPCSVSLISSALCRCPPGVTRCWSTVKRCTGVSLWSSTSPTCTCRLSCVWPCGCRSCPSRSTCQTLNWARWKGGGCPLSLTRGETVNTSTVSIFTSAVSLCSPASSCVWSTTTKNAGKNPTYCSLSERMIGKAVNIYCIMVFHTLNGCYFFSFKS